MIKSGFSVTESLGSSLYQLWDGIGGIGRFTLAATAIGGIITAVQAYKKHQAEIIQQAQENAEAYNDEVESLQDYRSEVESLTKSIESGTLSSNELYDSRLRLKEIQDSLAHTYGSSALEAANMDLLVASTEDAALAFDELAVARARAYLAENGSRGIEAVNKMSEDNGYILGHFNVNGLSAGARDALNNIVAMNDSLRLADGYVQGIGDTLRVETVGGAEDAKAAATDFLAEIEKLEAPIREELAGVFFGGGGSAISFSDATSGVIKEANSIIDNYASTAATYIDAVITGNEEYASIREKLTTAEQAYANAVSNSRES